MNRRLGITLLELEQWLKLLKREVEYENPTLDKTRRMAKSGVVVGGRFSR